jgi:2-hydroxychromene-2-carboxylate isomerase
MRDVLGAAGHDAGAVLARLDDAKDDLRRRTDEAIALGIFGAPAFVVGGEMYWGQDRIELVEKALMAGKG